MEKKRIGAKPFLYPMPTVLVGASVGGRPNYEAVAYCNMVSTSPPILFITSWKTHHTNKGIKENGTFSVNIPSAAMVTVTDYCGIVSGRRVDKSGLFTNFYGSLETAPMIKECPINLECKVVDTMKIDGSELFFGEIVEAYTEEKYLTDDLPDIQKISPIIYSENDGNYWRVGAHLGKAYKVGKKLKEKGAR
ncbi:flavin reductase family protein [Chloroflexota bacterium]